MPSSKPTTSRQKKFIESFDLTAPPIAHAANLLLRFILKSPEEGQRREANPSKLAIAIEYQQKWLNRRVRVINRRSDNYDAFGIVVYLINRSSEDRDILKAAAASDRPGATVDEEHLHPFKASVRFEEKQRRARLYFLSSLQIIE